MKILVMHPGALGDVILSLPALSLLRNHFGGAHLSVAGNLDFLPVICNGYADRFLSLSTLPLHKLYAGELSSSDESFWRGFDHIFSWTGFGSESFEKSLRSVHAAAHVLSSRPDRWGVRAASEAYIRDVQALLPAARCEAAFPRVKVDEDWIRRARVWTESAGISVPSIVAIHAGAGSPAKRWPRERFLELARRIRFCHGLLLLGGPAESGLAETLSQELSGERVIQGVNLPLDLLVGTLSDCRAFIGNDSGISHLAAAVGVPTLVLFGPTDPERWAPRGDHVRVLHRPGGCRGCEISIDEAHTCLENISSETCWNAFQGLLR